MNVSNLDRSFLYIGVLAIVALAISAIVHAFAPPRLQVQFLHNNQQGPGDNQLGPGVTASGPTTILIVPLLSGGCYVTPEGYVTDTGVNWQVYDNQQHNFGLIFSNPGSPAVPWPFNDPDPGNHQVSLSSTAGSYASSIFFYKSLPYDTSRHFYYTVTMDGHPCQTIPSVPVIHITK